MNSLLLIRSDGQPFAKDALWHIVRTVRGFKDIRYNLPDDGRVAAIDATYATDGDWALVDLNRDCTTISMRGTSDAALEAALVFQHYLQTPLRAFDSSYSFDLILSHYKTVAELRSAMQHAAGWTG